MPYVIILLQLTFVNLMMASDQAESEGLDNEISPSVTYYALLLVSYS